MRNYLTLLIIYMILPVLTQARQYFFTGSENIFYENPANWSPSYPGNVIQGNDIVIIQSSVNFEGFDLIVEGKLMIELGETITSGSNGIIVHASGLLQNEGEIGVDFIENYGNISNGLQSVIFTDKYYGSKETEIKGMISFSFQPGNSTGNINTKSMVYLCPSESKPRGMKPMSSNSAMNHIPTTGIDTSLSKTEKYHPSASSIRLVDFFSLRK
ncbi:MAG: hypothetical protein K1X92_02055 [Bacteroidia bacterium]|nr:hypothetical protein [Bacteroidia bacterium]